MHQNNHSEKTALNALATLGLYVIEAPLYTTAIANPIYLFLLHSSFILLNCITAHYQHPRMQRSLQYIIFITLQFIISRLLYYMT